MLDSYNEEVLAGKLSLAEAQKDALKKVAAIKYDGSNYVWINDYNSVMLEHPKLKGDQSALTDKNGVKLIADGTALAKEKGTGSVHYVWTKQGQPESNLYPKISFFRAYPSWGWVVGTVFTLMKSTCCQRGCITNSVN